MRKLKKIATVATLSMVMLTGCGASSEEKAVEALDLAATAKAPTSYKMDVNYIMDMKATYQEQTLEMAIKVDMANDVLVDQEKAHAKGTIDISYMGESQKVELETYTYKQDDAFVIASNDGSSDTWVTSQVTGMPDATLSKDEFKTLKKMDVLRTLNDGKVKKQETYQVAGRIEYKTLAEMMDVLGATEELVSVEDYEGKTFPVTYQFYKKDNRLASVSVDMKAVMKESLTEGFGENVEGLEVEVKDASFTITCYDYDKVEDFTIPELKVSESTNQNEENDDTSFEMPTYYLEENEKAFA